MKTFKFIGMLLVAILFSFTFVACSSDDDNNGSSTSLAGTTWKVASISIQDQYDWKGISGTFNSDGTITFSPSTDWNKKWTYAKWELKDGILRFTLGEGHPDDCIVGNITFNGNSATWDCYMEDAYGKWSGKEETHAIVKLEKQ